MSITPLLGDDMRVARNSLICMMMLLAASPLTAADNPDGPALERSLSRGRMLHLFDQAAWKTTDDMLARLPRDRLGEIGGWIVTPGAEGPHVDFFGKDGATGRALYSADLIDGKVVNVVLPPAGASALLGAPALLLQAALLSARIEMDKHADWIPCANARFNTVVLPPQADGIIPVYFMTPQVDDGIPFGGHYEVDVTPDGRIARTRAFSKACLTIRPADARTKGKPDFVFVTHLLDRQPTEMHVFQQLASGSPLLIGTVENRLMWTITRDGIAPPEPFPDK